MWTIAWLLVSDKIIGDHRLQHFLRNNFYQHPVELEHVTSTDALEESPWVRSTT